MTNSYSHTFAPTTIYRSTVEFELSIRGYVRGQMARLERVTEGPTYYNVIRMDASKEQATWHVSCGATHGDIVSVTMEVLQKAVDAVIVMYEAKQGGKLSTLMAPYPIDPEDPSPE
jgi:hypothetical protein